MCGRYTQTTELQTLQIRFAFDPGEVDLVRRYNIAPGQLAPVITGDNERRLAMMKWGLVPSWAKDPSIGHKMINARSETIAEKPSFRNGLRQRRCLVPADGFYEWQKHPDSKTKTPIHFYLKDHLPFAFAGIWERWIDPDGNDLKTCTLITTEANKLISPFHHRMPVILRTDHEAPWLDQKLTDPEQLRTLMSAYPPEEMEYHSVATLVNSPTNDSPECILPLAD